MNRGFHFSLYMKEQRTQVIIKYGSPPSGPKKRVGGINGISRCATRPDHTIFSLIANDRPARGYIGFPDFRTKMRSFLRPFFSAKNSIKHSSRSFLGQADSYNLLAGQKWYPVDCFLALPLNWAAYRKRKRTEGNIFCLMEDVVRTSRWIS